MIWKLFWVLLLVFCTKAILAFHLKSEVDNKPDSLALNLTAKEINSLKNQESVKSHNVSDQSNSKSDIEKAFEVRILTLVSFIGNFVN